MRSKYFLAKFAVIVFVLPVLFLIFLWSTSDPSVDSHAAESRVSHSVDSLPGNGGRQKVENAGDNATSAIDESWSPVSLNVAPANAETLGDLVSTARQFVDPDDESLNASLSELLSPESEARADAVLRAGFAGELQVIEPVLYMLAHDPSQAVRAAAAASLDVHPEWEKVSLALVDALEDQSPEVREEALLSLKAHRNGFVEKELHRRLRQGKLNPATAQEARLLLDRYYVRQDPFINPLSP
jgi:HEAT repeat protein